MAPVTQVIKLRDLKEDISRVTETESWITGGRYATVEDDRGRLVGILPVDEAGAPVPCAPLIDRFVVIGEDAFLQNLMVRMARHNASVGLVLNKKGVPRAHKVAGVIVRERIANAIINDISEIGAVR
jgi:hypothetical protein